MAIIRFDFDRTGSAERSHGYGAWPEGAYCPVGSSNLVSEREQRCGALVLWDEYVGLCLSDYERNGYDDSDFFMEIWSPEAQAVETILFATTRGWTYPSYGSRPDATPEVRELAAQWREQQRQLALKQERKARAELVRKKRALLWELAKRHGFAFSRIRKLMRSVPESHADAAVALLKSQKLRSAFRIAMQEQLVKWLKDSAPTYPTPFSYKQWEYV